MKNYVKIRINNRVVKIEQEDDSLGDTTIPRMLESALYAHKESEFLVAEMLTEALLDIKNLDDLLGGDARKLLDELYQAAHMFKDKVERWRNRDSTSTNSANS